MKNEILIFYPLIDAFYESTIDVLLILIMQLDDHKAEQPRQRRTYSLLRDKRSIRSQNQGCHDTGARAV